MWAILVNSYFSHNKNKYYIVILFRLVDWWLVCLGSTPFKHANSSQSTAGDLNQKEGTNHTTRRTTHPLSTLSSAGSRAGCTCSSSTDLRPTWSHVFKSNSLRIISKWLTRITGTMATAMFIGHSFVCHYADDKLSRHLGPDVNYSHPHATKLLAIHSGFSKSRYCKYLYTASKHIHLIEDIHMAYNKTVFAIQKENFQFQLHKWRNVWPRQSKGN